MLQRGGRRGLRKVFLNLLSGVTSWGVKTEKGHLARLIFRKNGLSEQNKTYKYIVREEYYNF